MGLSDKILNSIEDMGLPVIHGTAEQLAVLIDTVQSPCAALLDYGSSVQDVHGPQRVERASVSVFFLERTSPSFSPSETVSLYERCKKMADDWVERVSGLDDPDYSTLRVDGTVAYDRVNLRYKGMWGGIMVSATITDLEGFCAPSSQFK